MVSRVWICWETADWVKRMMRAVAVMFPVSAT